MKRVFILFITALALAPVVAGASIKEGVIDGTSKFAWGEQLGWLNFGTSGGDVKILDSRITGHIWSENFGWIRLWPAGSGGVLNDNEGDLSGQAWGENIGYIDFANVSITATGTFAGTASSSLGKISFDCANCTVKTDWRPRSTRPQCADARDNDNDYKVDYPDDTGCSSLQDDEEFIGGSGSDFPLPRPGGEPVTPKPVQIVRGSFESSVPPALRPETLKQTIRAPAPGLQEKTPGPILLEEEIPPSLKGEWKLLPQKNIQEFALCSQSKIWTACK